MKSERLKEHKKFIFLALLFTVYCLLFTDAYAGIEIKRDVLPQGLTLLVVERHNLPIVNITLGIKAGSLIEPPEKAGLSNLTVELLTEGTKKRTASQIDEEIEFIGASLETSGGYDYVTVSLSILKKDLDLGVDILSDVILNPVFPRDELNKKKTLIKGRLKAQEEDPDFLAGREFKKALFGLHPYGRLIEGTPETLDRLKLRDLIDFHSAYYVPQNAIMSVVGDITMEEIKGLLSKYFSGWQRKEFKIPSPQRPEPLKEKKVINIDKDITQANIILGHIGISRDNPDYYAISLMNYILGGGGFASRLMQNIREEKGLAYDISSRFWAQKEAGSFQVSLQTKNESANIAIEEILKEMNRIRETPVSREELSDAKAFLIGSFPLRIETTRKIVNLLLSLEYYGLGLDYINKYPTYIEGITEDDVLRVAKKYLDPERLTLVVVGDQKKVSLRFNVNALNNVR